MATLASIEHKEVHEAFSHSTHGHAADRPATVQACSSAVFASPCLQAIAPENSWMRSTKVGCTVGRGASGRHFVLKGGD